MKLFLSNLVACWNQAQYSLKWYKKIQYPNMQNSQYPASNPNWQVH